MALKEITQYFDDIDQTPLTENEVNVVRFGLGGNSYVMDLSEENARRFREMLEPYVQVARRERMTTTTRRRGTTTPRNSRAAQIRQWAQEQGKEVADRGKIPAEIVEAYNAAH